MRSKSDKPSNSFESALDLMGDSWEQGGCSYGSLSQWHALAQTLNIVPNYF